MENKTLQSLLDAARILDAAKQRICNEPTAVYKVVYHAFLSINEQLEQEMRGE